jgi:MFS family permease
VSGSYWRFWLAALLANVGDGIRLAAFPLLAASLTADPFMVATVTAVQALPWLMGGLAAGALADRKSARALMVLADSGRVIVLLALVALVVTDLVTVGAVLLAASVLGLAEIVRDTAAQTVVPRLVSASMLERANGRMVAAEVLGGEFIGPPVGAALFVVGAALPFIANGAALTLCVLLVLSIPMTLLSRGLVGRGDQALHFADGVVAGLKWLGGQRLLCGLLGSVAAIALADSAWFAILVLFVGNTLQLSGAAYGWLLAIGGVGVVLGAGGAERLIGVSRHRGTMTWSLLVSGVAPVVLLFSPTLWAVTGVVVVSSASFAVLNVASVSVRHRLVPPGMLGRTTAAARTLTYGASAVGALTGGAIASAAGLSAPFVLTGVIGVVATAAWLMASKDGLELPPEPA